MMKDIASMKREFGTITAIVPCFEREQSLSAALDSIHSQTMSVDEIIVVDDGSGDDTVAVAQKWMEKHPSITVKLLEQSLNKGPAVARNVGISHATGTWIAFLDSDDRWYPNKIELQVHGLLKMAAEWGMSYTGFRYVDDDQKELGYFTPKHRGKVYPAILGSALLRTTSTFLVRKIYLDQVGGFDEHMRSCEDWDLCIRLSRVTKVATVSVPLIDYLEGSGKARISRDFRRNTLGHMQIRKKYQADSQFSKRIQSEQLLTIADLLLRMGRMKFGRKAMRAVYKLTPLRPKAFIGLILSQLARDAKTYTQSKELTKKLVAKWGL